jgi:hypothetical protein
VLHNTKKTKRNGVEFNENAFKRDYESGQNLKIYGLNKKVEAGSVEKIQTSTEINSDRRTAYANSLESPEREEGKAAVKTFFAEWKKGIKNMTTTAGGLAVTATAGALTGGAGIFIKAIQKTVNPSPENPEVVAAIRKGEDPNKKLIDELKKLTKTEHGNSEALSGIAKKMTGGGDAGGHTETTPPAAGTTH